MTFAETRFPVDISYGSNGGPEFATDVVVTQGGFEQRNINWAEARARYNIAHGIKSQEQLDALIVFFRARRGKAEGFRFKDWTDYQAIGVVFGEGDGAETAFQLRKPYTDGGITVNRTITKPVADSEAIYINSVLKTTPAHYTLNTVTGIVTFATPPTDGTILSADFEFDVPVRFDTDRLSASLDSYGSYSWKDIPLIEIRI
ncbi:MAG: hypothetical protein K0R63_964 [Rickettsiales bacterium]|jgi:uncharacterized protein (TIGR02217 family)|nr:hypothetical protein [Rickettsiales bacterium]